MWYLRQFKDPKRDDTLPEVGECLVSPGVLRIALSIRSNGLGGSDPNCPWRSIRALDRIEFLQLRFHA